MNYYNVIGLLNTSMAAIFCAAMLVIWKNNRNFSYILILGISYTIRSLCFGVFYFAFSMNNPVLRFSANVLLMLSMLLLSAGLSHRRHEQPRYAILLTMAAIALGSLYYNQFIEQSLFARVVVLNFGLAVVSLLMMLDAAKSSKRTPVEQVLFGLMLVSCAGFLLRPLFLTASGATAEQSEGAYWLVVSISDALICAMMAVGFFAIIASDLMEGIKSDAQIDTLSGLLNRRGFEPRALGALARQATDRPAAMILSDLDHFKSINDRFGHSGGDRIIQKFSAVLKETVPRDAVMARLGGEEFAILLPPGAAAAAHRVAEEVRSTFRQVAIDLVAGEANPTASFGIAVARQNEDLNTLIDRADRALYQAKHDGRDCVRMAE
jgi:diguanylate cyclase (GGDEF)-like protein